MVDLSAINLLRNFHFDTKTAAAITMSDVVKVQYDLLQQTKNVVANVCDNIAKDVISLLAPIQQNNVFFATDKKERKLSTDSCFNFVKVVLSVFVSSISYVLKNTILRYLGLLFTFDGITISKRYKKAYSM